MNYSLLAWGNKNNKIELLQRKAVRLIIYLPNNIYYYKKKLNYIHTCSMFTSFILNKPFTFIFLCYTYCDNFLNICIIL